MRRPVKRPYDNSRRLAQAQATRLRLIEAAKTLFLEQGYGATTLESVAEGAEVSLPTLYRLFGSKRALLTAVLETSFVGDDQPISFVDRPAVRAALSEPDGAALLDAFAAIAREFMDRSSGILHVLATAAQTDAEAADLLAEIRRQRHTGQTRIVAALVERGALDPTLDPAEASDFVYLLWSPDTHRTLTVDRGWTPQQYEKWLAHAMRSTLLAP
jgi:TetR/AcrR family transcriptional regulator, regulator of autoinduction and epiphytic fitness